MIESFVLVAVLVFGAGFAAAYKGFRRAESACLRAATEMSNLTHAIETQREYTTQLLNALHQNGSTNVLVAEQIALHRQRLERLDGRVDGWERWAVDNIPGYPKDRSPDVVFNVGRT